MKIKYYFFYRLKDTRNWFFSGYIEDEKEAVLIHKKMSDSFEVKDLCFHEF